MSNPFSSGSPFPDPRFTPPPRSDQGADAWQFPPAAGLQRAVLLLAWPMVLLGAFWFGFGHAVLAGGGGWMILVGMLIAAPAYIVVAGVNAVLVTMYARKRGQKVAGIWQSRAAIVFYALTLVYPLTVPDFGDTGPGLPSRLTAWFGVPENTSAFLFYALWWVMTVLAILMIVGGAVDLSLLNRQIAAQRAFRGYAPGYGVPQPGYGPGYAPGYGAPQPGYGQSDPYYPDNR